MQLISLIFRIFFKSNYYSFSRNITSCYLFLEERKWRLSLSNSELLFLSWLCQIGSFALEDDIMWRTNRMLHDYNFSELRESITSNSSEFEEQFSYYIRELCWIFLAINNTNSDVYSEMKYNRKFALSEVRKWIMDAKKQRLSDIEITHMLSMILHIPEISLFIQTPPELIFNIIHDE